jgi:hypothetical protein
LHPWSWITAALMRSATDPFVRDVPRIGEAPRVREGPGLPLVPPEEVAVEVKIYFHAAEAPLPLCWANRPEMFHVAP